MKFSMIEVGTAIKRWHYSINRLLGCSLVCFTTCADINTGAPILEVDPALKGPASGASRICIMMLGAEVDRTDWAASLTVSRFFGSRLENRSGSLRTLLEPALGEILRRQGYRSELASPDSASIPDPDSGASKLDGILLVEIKKNKLIYAPPQEFIQTRDARRPGRIEVDFEIKTYLVKIKNGESVPCKLPDNQQIPEKIASIIQSDKFDLKSQAWSYNTQNRIRVDDSSKRVALSRTGYQVLRNYSVELMTLIPDASQY